MNTQMVSKTRWFWAWQDEKEEAWLEEMSRQGLHLDHFGFPGWYFFRQGEPRDFAYRLDFITATGKDQAGYYQIFQDAGWEHVGNYGGWQYFRKERKPGESAEIYTDNQSKVKKYERLAGFLVIFLPILLINFTNLVRREENIFMLALLLVYVLVLGVYIYAMINLIRRISELRKRL